jgi:hypothetical protein
VQTTSATAVQGSSRIEYDRATGNPVDERIAELIDTDGPLVVTEPVITEVVAGTRGKAGGDDLRRLMLRGERLHFDAATEFDGGALIYRRCRQVRITPRGMIDCMIAAVAWRRDAGLLCYDVDLERVPAAIGIELDQASVRR